MAKNSRHGNCKKQPSQFLIAIEWSSACNGKFREFIERLGDSTMCSLGTWTILLQRGGPVKVRRVFKKARHGGKLMVWSVGNVISLAKTN